MQENTYRKVYPNLAANFFQRIPFQLLCNLYARKFQGKLPQYQANPCKDILPSRIYFLFKIIMGTFPQGAFFLRVSSLGDVPDFE
jgi:hypothetical protein